MKKWTLLILSVVLMFSFTACSSENKNPKVSDVMSRVRNEIEFPEMSEKSVDDLASYGYDQLDSSKIEESSFIIASSGSTAEEVFIVKLKDADAIDDLKKMMETRRDQIAETAADYTPEEMDKITKAVIETKGNYAFFAITGNNTQAKKIFSEEF